MKNLANTPLENLLRATDDAGTSRGHLLILCNLFLAIFLATGLASSAAADGSPTFGDILDVRLVNLEVVVEHKGDRVPGLSSDDFQLLVDGEEVPIEFFSEIRQGEAIAAPSSQEFPSTPSVEPGKQIGTRYLVFVDDYFAIPSYRNRVLNQLQKDLSSLGPNDSVAMVAFDGQHVELLTSWTRSDSDLTVAIDQAKDRRAYGLQRLSEDRYYSSVARFQARDPRGSRFANVGYYGARTSLGSGFYGYGLHGNAYFRGNENSQKIARVVSAATSALRGFAQPEGRKVMLLLSGGWPASAYPGYANGGGGDTVPLQSLFRPLVDTANRLGYTLYPVDLNNNRDAIRGSAEFGSVAESDFAEYYHRDRDWIEEDALIHLASSTGGKAYLDGAARFALSRTADDTHSYYWIGFSPRWQEDDAQHRVKVKVAGKGLKVRTRDGFSDLSRQTEVTMLVESAQLFNLPLPGSDLVISVGAPTKAGYKKVLLPLNLEIPYERLTLLPGGSGQVASLELRVAATDEDGNRADIPVIPVEITRGTDGQAVAVYTTQLKLRQKDHRLLVSLYDPATGEVMSKRFDISL